MKSRVKKLFILSLILLFTAGLSVTTAQQFGFGSDLNQNGDGDGNGNGNGNGNPNPSQITYNVINRNPFGVLTLTELNIKTGDETRIKMYITSGTSVIHFPASTTNIIAVPLKRVKSSLK